MPVMVVAECSRTANNTWVCKRASRIRASRKVSSHSTSNARCVTYWKHLAPLPQTLHPLEHLYLHTTFASDYPVLTHPLPLTVNCDSRTRTHRQLKVHLNRIHPTRQQIHHVLQITPGIHLRTRKDCIYYTMSSRHRYRTAIPQVDAALTPELSRSSSVVSSMAPAAARKSNVQDVSLQRAPGAQCAPSPLRVASLGTQGRQQDGAPPAFRFVAPGQEPLPSSPSYSQLSPTSPTPSQEPSPTFSTTATLVNQPSMLFTPADPEVDDG